MPRIPDAENAEMALICRVERCRLPCQVEILLLSCAASSLYTSRSDPLTLSLDASCFRLWSAVRKDYLQGSSFRFLWPGSGLGLLLQLGRHDTRHNGEPQQAPRDGRDEAVSNAPLALLLCCATSTTLS